MNNNSSCRAIALNDFFYKTPKKLIPLVKKKIINHSDLAVYSRLLDIFSADWDHTRPSQEFIANGTGLERKCVSKILNKLKKLGFIHFEKINGFSSCTYTLNNPDEIIEKLLSKSNILDMESHNCDKENMQSLYGDTESLYGAQFRSLYSDPVNNKKNKENEILVLNSELDKEEGIKEVGLKSGSVNEVLLEEIPPTPLLNDTIALDANALIADSQEIKLKLVRSSKKKPTGQLVLRSSFVDDEGTIHIQLITNEDGLEINNIVRNDQSYDNDILRAANDRIEGNMFTKAQQVGVRPEKKKKGISNRSQKKDDRFETVYSRFYQACQKNGYDLPSRHQSNRQIDFMIETYGVERLSQLVECAVENWHRIKEIVSNSFNQKQIPTLAQITLGFVAESLNAHLIAKEKGLVDKPKKKRKSKKDKNQDKDMSFLNSIIDEASNG